MIPYGNTEAILNKHSYTEKAKQLYPSFDIFKEVSPDK